MEKMNNILKMISKLESNANDVKLAKHEVELATIYDDIKGTMKEANIDFINA